MFDLFPFSFRKIFPNIVVWAMFKSFKSNKFICILNISELFDVAPGFIMVVLDNRWVVILLHNLEST